MCGNAIHPAFLDDPNKMRDVVLKRVRSLGLDELRTLWRTTLRSSSLPKAFNREFLARAICWHIQERALGRSGTVSATVGRSGTLGIGRDLKAPRLVGIRMA
jgi:hypothetical protein